MPSISRRELLAGCAAGLTAGLAGCADPDAVMYVEPVSAATDIATEATTAPDSRDAETAALVAETVAGGTNRTSRNDRGNPPYQPDRPVRYNGTVYDLDWNATGRQQQRTEHLLSLTIHDADSDYAPEVSFDELPAVDQERLTPLPRVIDNIQEANETAGLPEPFERQAWYPPAEREASALVPEPAYDTIEVNGYPVTVTVEPVTVQLPVFAYTATERASSLAAFGRELRSAHRFPLTGLSDAEHEFFKMVIEEGSFYKGGFDDVDDGVFEGVADQFVREPALFTPYESEAEWLTRYDGTDYWVTIDFVRMSEHADRIQAVEEL
ncbi:hypothetical protein [Halonotius pteroides]|uniref:Uncharacterized protein n=1 Tax=Halonotius pteroides TaxID=268735 RepID=A0A3A6QT54_9EURY|nr:hypothetical protein [Halonotius pteroides]RJX51819.1 hypothetical protein DP106_00440 [Halonotius pteroides]